MSAVIFDLDGTLIDSAPDIHFCVNRLLKNHRYEPIEFERVRSFIGNGIPKLVEQVMVYRKIEFSKELHQSLSAELKQIYKDKPIDKNSVYPNVEQCLTALKNSGFKLGICTNKAHDLAQAVIKELGFGQYFSAIIGGDSLPTNKPNPAMLFACMKELGVHKATFVGDSEIDAETAKNAGVPFILFSEGYLKQPIEETYHDAIFNDFSQLEKKLQLLY